MVYDRSIQCTENGSGGVRASGLGKRFGDFWALRDFDLDVESGTVLGLLGHNGAGKTTAIRMLTTLSRPNEGSASVAGFDIATQSADVRTRIGVASQSATVDGLLTARRNLEMVGRLYRMSASEARARAEELLERVELTAEADRLVKTFSGGMRRRLDLAASLVANPPVLFLDEPTTGLDPHSRSELWDLLRERAAAGTTIVLTTQYLEEADLLADNIVLLDHGRTVATGTPAELKQRIGGRRVVVNVERPDDWALAADALVPFTDGAVQRVEDDELALIAPVRQDARLVEIVRALDAAGVDALDVHRRDPTLDDVFLTLTNFDSTRSNA